MPCNPDRDGGSGYQALLESKRREHRARLESSLRTLVERLSGMPAVQRILLFGSYASGRRDLFTDLDLIVVMESQDDFLTRTVRLYRLVPDGVDVDLLAYTPEELDRLRRFGFLKAALSTSKVLYEKK